MLKNLVSKFFNRSEPHAPESSEHAALSAEARTERQPTHEDRSARSTASTQPVDDCCSFPAPYSSSRQAPSHPARPAKQARLNGHSSPSGGHTAWSGAVQHQVADNHWGQSSPYIYTDDQDYPPGIGLPYEAYYPSPKRERHMNFASNVSRTPAMHHSKPGRNASFQPMNTLYPGKHGRANMSKPVSASRSLFPSTPPRQRDYSRKSRSAHGPGPGQQAFLRNFEDGSMAKPARTSMSSPLADSRSDSNKRRKTHHRSSPGREIRVIDLSGDDEDEVQIVTPAPAANVHSHHWPIPPSRDGSSNSSSKRRAPPGGEFSNADGVLNSRKRSKKNKSDRSDSISYFAREIPGQRIHQGLNINVVGDDVQIVPKYATNGGLAEELQRNREVQPEAVRTASMSEEDELHTADPATIHTLAGTTPVAPGVNPSNQKASRKAGAAISTATTASRDVRDHFKGPSDQAEKFDDPDADELAQDVPNQSRHGQNKSTSAQSAPANNLEESMIAISPHGWPLAYARSHGLDEQGPNLALESRFDPKKSEILRVTDDGTGLWLADIVKVKVNRVVHDETSRMRIEGPADTSGQKYWYDLRFLNPKHLQDFEDILTKGRNAAKLFTRTAAEMESMHRKPLSSHHPSTTQAAVPDAEIELIKKRADRGTRQNDQRPPRRTLLINEMHPCIQEKLRPKEPDSSVEEIPKHTLHKVPLDTPVNSPVRPKRATRASQPSYLDLEEQPHAATVEEPAPFKYSEDIGLGKPWSRPLQFGTGRRAALVNFSDLERLDEGEFLNDSLIDFYITYLAEQAGIPPNKVYFFNTHFYSTLTRPVPGQKGSINYAGVARWTAKVDIFSYDYIVVPVNEHTHWYLAVICNVSNISRKPKLAEAESSSPTPTIPSEPASESIIVPLDEQSDATYESPSAELNTAGKTDVSFINEDLNLFDEASKNDQHNTLSDSDGIVPARESSPGTSAGLQSFTLNDGIPKSILDDVSSSPRATKMKAKRKNGPPPKKYDSEAPIIIILDSLGNAHPKTVRALKDYIREEGDNKRGMEANITSNAFYVRDAHIPMQPNYTDCGVYLLAYVQKFMDDPRRFVTRILSRDMDVNADWPDMSAPRMRNTMREILQGLYKQQEEAHRQEKKNKKQAPPAITAPSTAARFPSLKSPVRLTGSTKPESNGDRDTPQAEGVSAEASSIKPARKMSPKVVIEVKTTPRKSMPESKAAAQAIQTSAEQKPRGLDPATTAGGPQSPFTKSTQSPGQKPEESRLHNPGSESAIPKGQEQVPNYQKADSPKRRHREELVESASPKRRKIDLTKEAVSPAPAPKQPTPIKSPSRTHTLSEPRSKVQKQLNPHPFKRSPARSRTIDLTSQRHSSLDPTFGKSKSPANINRERGSSEAPITIDDSQETATEAKPPLSPITQPKPIAKASTPNHVSSAGVKKTQHRSPSPVRGDSHVAQDLLARLDEEDAYIYSINQEDAYIRDKAPPTPPLQQPHSPSRSSAYPGHDEDEEEWNGFDTSFGSTIPESPEEQFKKSWSHGDPLPH